MNLIKILSVLLSALFATFSCNGFMDGIYDEPPVDNSYDEGFHTGTKPNRFKLQINATSYTEWIYVNLKTRELERKPIPSALTGEWDGQSGWTYNLVEGTKYTALAHVKTDAQPEPSEWDFAIHHFDARTHGGQVYETPYTSLNALPPSSKVLASASFTADAWSTTQVITDLKDMMSFKVGFQNLKVNEVLSRWVRMDFSTPPPVYTASGRVYILRLADGTHAAMQMLNYMSPSGTKGYLSIDVIYPY